MGSGTEVGTPEQVEPVEILEPTRTSGDGPRRGRGPRNLLVLVAVLVLVAGALAVAVNRPGGDGDGDAEQVNTFAPDVTVGDANLVVMATTFDAQGARTLIPASVVTALGTIPGVRASEGVLRARVVVRGSDDKVLGHGRSTIALSWNGTAGLELHEGRPPATRGEIAIDVGTLAEHDLQVGDEVRVDSASMSTTTATRLGSAGLGGESATIVGSFTVAGDEAGVPGVAITAFDAATLLEIAPRGPTPGFDRVDLIAADGVDLTELLNRVAAALPPDTQVVPASELGNREQLRAELEIQRAFFDLLSLDQATRTAAVEGANLASPEVQAQGNATFQRYLSQLVNVEFRIQRVNFLDADHASLVFMTYYGSQPSPVLTVPFDAHAVRIDGRWKISSSTVCTLTLLGGAPCVPQPGSAVEPPPGWQLPETQPDVTAAFTRAGNANATVVVSGVRLVDADHAEVFYSVTAPKQPNLETPYPLVARAIRVAGLWQPEAPVL